MNDFKTYPLTHNSYPESFRDITHNSKTCQIKKQQPSSDPD